MPVSEENLVSQLRRLCHVIVTAKPTESWAIDLLAALPRGCRARRSAYPTFDDIPEDCTAEVCGLMSKSEWVDGTEAVLMASTAKRQFNLPATSRRLALEYAGWDFDRKQCKVCARTAPPDLTHDQTAVELLLYWSGFEISFVGRPIICDLDVLALKVPAARKKIRMLGRQSDARVRAQTSLAIRRQFLPIVPLIIVSAGLIFLGWNGLADLIGSWSFLLNAAIPIVPGAFAVNRTTAPLQGLWRMPWRQALLGAAIAGILPQMLFLGIELVLPRGDSVGWYCFLSSICAVSDFLVFYLYLRHLLTFDILRFVMPDLQGDPTNPA